jgi:hypothetical protein
VCPERKAAFVRPHNDGGEDWKHKQRSKSMKEDTKTANATKDKKHLVSDMAEQVVKNYEQAFRAGIKMQEEAVQCVSKWFNQCAPADDLQRRLSKFTNLVNEYVPENEKRVEELVDLMEKNTRTGTDLLKKAADAAQSPVMGEGQDKWIDFYAASLGAVRSTTEALTQINGKAIDSFIDFVQRSSDLLPIRAAKAA